MSSVSARDPKDLVDEIWFDDLVRASRRVHIPKGDTLRHAGDSASTLDIVVSGHVEFWKILEDGREVWLGACGRGDAVGTSLLIPTDAEPFDMVALSNVALLRLTREAVMALGAQHPDFTARLSSRLASLLAGSRRLVVAAQTLSAKGRIEAELLRLSEPIGNIPGQRVVRPSPIFADMARRANTTRETVSRTVAALGRAGVVDRRPGALVILEPERLG